LSVLWFTKRKKQRYYMS